MNKIIITGRLTRDMEIKVANSGVELCNFNVAVERRAKNGDERQCDFIDCTAFGKTAAFLNEYFHKGDGITVEGRMESRKWQDKDGKNRVAWGVTVDVVEFAIGRSHAGACAQPVESSTFKGAQEVPEEDLPF